jgi:Spy/CpxP family protein refolding chaperone
MNTTLLPRLKERIDNIKLSLDLSEDQTNKIKGVFADDFDKLNSLRADISISQDVRRSKIEEIRKKQRHELSATLTPTQLAQWKEELDIRREELGEDGYPLTGNRAAVVEERLRNIKDTLKLSDDQVAKVKDVFVSDFQNLKDLRANTSISQDNRRSKIEEIRRKQRQELNAILVPNQRAEWKKELDMRREAFGVLFN